MKVLKLTSGCRILGYPEDRDPQGVSLNLLSTFEICWPDLSLCFESRQGFVAAEAAAAAAVAVPVFVVFRLTTDKRTLWLLPVLEILYLCVSPVEVVALEIVIFEFQPPFFVCPQRLF